jgi:arsenate reductase
MSTKRIKFRILFLCTGNSCRSQMAEGFARVLFGDKYEVFSAGVESHGLNPNAVTAMKEIGIDISSQHSKTVDEVPWKDMDIIITLCGHAAETCPTVPVNTLHLHWGLDDPAKARGTEEKILRTYRRIRDQLHKKIREFAETGNINAGPVRG